MPRVSATVERVTAPTSVLHNDVMVLTRLAVRLRPAPRRTDTSRLKLEFSRTEQSLVFEREKSNRKIFYCSVFFYIEKKITAFFDFIRLRDFTLFKYIVRQTTTF